MELFVNKLLIKYENFSLSINNLTIPSGINLLIGPNGAGKTTFMESLIGLRVPEIHNIDLNNKKLTIPLKKEFKEKLAFIPSTLFIQKRKTLDYYMHLWEILYPDFETNIYTTLLKEFEIDNKKKIIELSSGQRRMFLFSLQLAYKPSIFIMDEPFAFLDVKQSKKMLNILIEYAKSNREATILISSHLINWLQKFNFYTLIINNGRIIKSGFIKEDYERFF